MIEKRHTYTVERDWKETNEVASSVVSRCIVSKYTKKSHRNY